MTHDNTNVDLTNTDTPGEDTSILEDTLTEHLNTQDDITPHTSDNPDKGTNPEGEDESEGGFSDEIFMLALQHENEKIQRRLRRRKIAIIAAIVAIILLIVAGIAGIIVRHNMVVTDCNQTNTAYTTAYQAYEKQYKQAQEVAQTITSADQVADQATYTTFDNLVKSKLKKATALNCSISYADTFSAANNTLDSQTHTVTQTTADLKKAVKNVQDSKDKKDFNDARTNAQTQLDQANSLYTSSEGQVQDNATRDSLKTRIDEAQKVLNDKKSTLENINSAVAPLNDAMNQVSQSIQAKKDADAQAQAQAQAQQQQAQAQRSTPQRRSTGGSTQRRSGGNSGGSYSNNGGNAGGNTGGSGNAGGSDWQSWMNRPDNSPCAVTGTCSQAVG